ncbi:unnamed protein product [Ostreobium quekettii]|uniref:Large ribosomal subunit protein uL6c n=1 Tax=Ostreobium quekettii TaxID=121088 RepID=A0A8S1IVP6_9CHLO|nr:unnamed protein product [Ostreobium quekettii]|eukprot:evm.model.scf_668EXC.8 EVM.evm.TU.scf_668EXC.8   scf_668EXC:53698-55912(-)
MLQAGSQKGGPVSSRPGGRPLARYTAGARPGPRRRLQVLCGESRIGKKPVPIPSSVSYTLEGNFLKVKGPKGELERTFSNHVGVTEQEGSLVFTRKDDSRKGKAMHGLARALCNNMVVGVSEGFEIKLQMIGVGYRASTQGQTVTLNVGYCHPVVLDVPEGVKVQVEKNTNLTVSGYNKEIVGNFAAVMRSKRPPEPYKGKGIRYLGEEVRMKEGKKGK